MATTEMSTPTLEHEYRRRPNADPKLTPTEQSLARVGLLESRIGRDSRDRSSSLGVG
ncbi:MAG: hypothetical protein ACQETI_01735 [Halobacteriota archaeon]